MELLLSSEEGIEPGSSKEADIHNAHRRVKRVLRRTYILNYNSYY